VKTERVLRSSAPDIVVPDIALVSYLLAGAARHGEKVALVDHRTGETLSYRTLREQVGQAAEGLRASGVTPGTVVALFSENQPRFAVAALAVVAAGAVLSPVSPLSTEHEVAVHLHAAGAGMLVVSEALAQVGSAAAASVGISEVYVLGNSARSFDLLLGERGQSEVVIDPYSVAVLPFSSGTTGLPKGVQLSHRNIVANLEQLRTVMDIDESETFCAVLPFTHIYGLTVILFMGLLRGVTIVTFPRFELTSYLATVQERRVRRLHVVPPIVLALANDPVVDNYDLSSVWLVSSGAAPLDSSISRRVTERLGCLIGQGYGMTEASPGITYVPDAEAGTIPAGTVGRLLSSTEARLVDPSTQTDASGEGELWVRGPQVMLGYLGAEEGAASGLLNGWLPTGDLATVDEEGIYRIVGRLKELIKYNGYQVAPAELEALLLEHSAVIDAAVVGVPDPAAGENPTAVVVTNRPVEVDELLEWVNSRVSPYKKIRALHRVAAIPKTASGKILRRAILAAITTEVDNNSVEKLPST
jgi:acyl-CoA synthetase (AMP-forming)/AMP-acid ligase II